MDLHQEAQKIQEQAECIFTDSEVQAALDNMADQIRQQLAGTNPIVCCVMNGGLITTAELLKRLDFPLQVNFLHASRYHDSTEASTGLEWHAMPQLDLDGRTMLIVDDILDEGLTLKSIIAACKQQGAKEVLSAVLTHKNHDRKIDKSIKADFVGLEVPDRYVFGYGMDYRSYLRNVSGIYAIAE